MIYLILLIMMLIVVRFFVKNKYFFFSNIKLAIATYVSKPKSEKNADIFYGALFLFASIFAENMNF